MSFTQDEGGWSSQPQQQHHSDQGSGASDAGGGGDAQAATVAAMQAASGQQAPSGQGQGQQAQAQPSGNPFLDGIMEQIDPAHRPIVEPYLGKWNAGVTRRFQDLHGELAPYKELGADPETLSEAYQLYQLIDSDPQQVLEILQEAVAEMGGGTPQGVGDQPAPGETQPSALPPEMAQLQERFGTFEKVLEAMAEQMLSQKSSEQEAAEDAELDDYLGLLKQEFGEYDEDFVIAKMMAGASGEDAVKAYQQAVQAQVNQRARQPDLPPIMGGGGSVPQSGRSVVDASSKDTKALVANILASSQQQ